MIAPGSTLLKVQAEHVLLGVSQVGRPAVPSTRWFPACVPESAHLAKFPPAQGSWPRGGRAAGATPGPGAPAVPDRRREKHRGLCASGDDCRYCLDCLSARLRGSSLGPALQWSRFRRMAEDRREQFPTCRRSNWPRGAGTAEGRTAAPRAVPGRESRPRRRPQSSSIASSSRVLLTCV